LRERIEVRGIEVKTEVEDNSNFGILTKVGIQEDLITFRKCDKFTDTVNPVRKDGALTPPFL
jgi:hypothetical protein